MTWGMQFAYPEKNKKKNVMTIKNYNFIHRTANLSDLPQLLELEKVWPEMARASYETLKFRIERFSEGFFVAEDETGLIGSIICHPYHYQPQDLSNFADWESVVKKCYETNPADANALYIIAGTTKPSAHGGEPFNSGMEHVTDLAQRLGKQYVLGGCILPGYMRYINKHGEISVSDYVFKKTKNRLVDPLLEKYRRHDFHVTDKNNIIANYYLDDSSFNYSALVVKNIC
jgi:hypothetical protein